MDYDHSLLGTENQGHISTVKVSNDSNTVGLPSIFDREQFFQMLESSDLQRSATNNTQNDQNFSYTHKATYISYWIFSEDTKHIIWHNMKQPVLRQVE